MSEKSFKLCIEDFGDSAIELEYLGWQTTSAASDNQSQDPHRSMINLGEAPDGGLRAWLVVVASVHY